MADAMTNLLDSASAEAVQNLSPIIASLFLRPKRLRVLRIERIGAHAAGHIGVVLDLGDVTVLAIVAATASAGATMPLQTVVAAPCGTALYLKAGAPGGVAALIESISCWSASGVMWRLSSVRMPPGSTAMARTPRSLCRRSNSTANRTLAVFERP
jgi:hypothetical protein